jgi:hypothetical protein
VNVYKQLYAKQYNWRPKLDGLSFLSIDVDERNWMEKEFEESEVLEVVRNFNGDKAPDGFSVAFSQKCWELLTNDIMEVFKEFHSQGKFEKSYNATFVSFIPKKAGVVENKDFYPISLLGGMYKIICKVLGNKLKLVLGYVVSSSHNVFI